MNKKLYRSTKDRKICGVCAGIGNYFNIDPTVIRLIFVICGISWVGVPVYIAAAILMPRNDMES